MTQRVMKRDGEGLSAGMYFVIFAKYAVEMDARTMENETEIWEGTQILMVLK